MSSSYFSTIAFITSLPVITPESSVKIFATLIFLIWLTIISAQSKQRRHLCTSPICLDIIFSTNSFFILQKKKKNLQCHQDYLLQLVAFLIKLKSQTNISYHKNHKGVVDSVILIFFIAESYRRKLKK